MKIMELKGSEGSLASHLILIQLITSKLLESEEEATAKRAHNIKRMKSRRTFKQDYFKKLYESMPKQIEVVIQA